MSALRELTISQKLYVARVGEEEWFVSSLQDLNEDGLYIAMPYLRGGALVLSPGEEVQVRFVRESGVYLFVTRVLGRRDESVPLYLIAYPAEVQRIQQRRFVRLPILLEVLYAPASDKPGEQPVWARGRTADLSGGGMRLRVSEPLPAGTPLLLKFYLPWEKRPVEMTLRGRVVRSEVTEGREAGERLYFLGIEFVDIRRRDQDEIIRFIFRKMAERR
ncbi:MAG: PilZ domain-containing protein [Firmicutes bacterium]|nr:PilZ domain-containing protein [Bacillota bacterium]